MNKESEAYMYSESNSMEISVLGCDNNLNIFEKDIKCMAQVLLIVGKERFSLYEKAENAIETNPEQFKSLNDLFEELGWKDERTEEEKDFSYSIDVIEGKAYSQVYNKYFEMEKYYLTK